MAKTYWALKHVLFVFNYKALTIHGEEEQRILKRHDPKMPQSVERKRFIWFLKLSTKIRFFDLITMKVKAKIK